MKLLELKRLSRRNLDFCRSKNGLRKSSGLKKLLMMRPGLKLKLKLI